MAENQLDIQPNYNPALEALKFNNLVNDDLNKKARSHLDEMNKISTLYNNVTALNAEFKIRSNTDKKGINYIDFENSEFQGYIDALVDNKLLDERKYKFETQKEVENFKTKLECIDSQLKNKNQEPLLLIQPLLNLMELMNRIAKTCSEQQEKLIEKTNIIPR